ncbi:hemoblobin-interacting domain-containing protein [Paenibacillus whitsoniae]|nr:hemoblobin-interacting domain-containing protein [Paenibacillus whitsoniae]
MKLHIAWKKALHLLLALALVVPGLLWSQSQTFASGPAWRDIKSNADSGASYLAGENGKLYLLYSNKILVRGASDANWSKLVDLPANTFTQANKLVVRNGDLYILDHGNESAYPNAIPSKIMKSSDNGQTWTDVPGPAGGFPTLNGDYLSAIFFDTQGNLYAVSFFAVYKRDKTTEAWTVINAKPNALSKSYRISSAGVDAAGNLYSIMYELNDMGAFPPLPTAVYRWDGNAWATVNVTLPAGNMWMFVDASGVIHMANGSTNFMLSSKPHIYTFDGSSLHNTATTSNMNWTIGGVVFDGEYYYILDYSPDGIIRTTSPTFGNLKAPPTLTGDTTDNDTTHAIELVYAEDADWLAAITSVEFSPSAPSAQADWTQPGKITITGLTKGGSYTVKVKATGYSNATAVQTVSLVPSVWYDITADSSMLAPVLSVSGAVYSVQLGEEGLFFRSESDMKWQSEAWPPQEEFGSVYTYVARGNDRYIGDLTNPMTPNSIVVRISTDSGSSWSSYPLPQNAVTDGALNPLTVSQTGAVYLFGSKNLFKLDESRNWSQIPVLPDAGDDKFAYTGVAVNAAGKVFANIRKYNLQQPLNNTAKLYQLDTSGSTPQWTVVADSPSAVLNLYTDTAGGMHASTGAVLFGETPGAYVYQFDENGFTQAATLDSLAQAKYGVAYENGYYYIVDGDDYQTIRTTNPNFNTGLASPALTADTSDNDDANTLDLTFEDDADWRSQITSVTFKKSGTVVEATYQMSPGVLHVMQPLEGGTYTIEIAATGYRKSTVQQTVLITAPILTADTTNNDDAHGLDLTFTDNANWRSQITSVTFKKNGSIVEAAYQVSPGVLHVTQPLEGGTYTIEIAAAGYRKSTVQQTVLITAPTLTADTSDNDDAHGLDLTFTDNADWRSQISNVTFEKNGTFVEASYQVSSGVLHVTQPLEAGIYTIEIAAAGYTKSTAEQTVLITAPTLTADTSGNDDSHELELTFTDNADWRSQITSVTIQKNGIIVEAPYEVLPGVLHVTKKLEAGTYTIEIAATGYTTSTVEQTVLITAPTLTADSTNNDTDYDIEITFTDNALWRSALTSVAYNGQTADSSTYVLSEGKLLVKKGTLPAGTAEIRVKAAGYLDATVTQDILAVPSQSDSSSNTGADTPNTEIITIDVLGGSSSGSVVSQAEIVRTKDDKGIKHDKVSLTSELAARAVDALKSTGTGQAVIVVPDTKDEVADIQVSLPREALGKLTNAGVGLTIETRGASIQIPVASLSASSGDLYFHVVPVKDIAAQQEVGERAKTNGASEDVQNAAVVGRPMTIETNLQSQPVQLTLPLGDYTADIDSRLMVYIEHSDGTKEWVKGEQVSDDAGKPAIRFTVSKFSTFTIIDAKSALPIQAYIEGYEDGTFRPEAAVTRGQLAAMLDRLYGNRAATSDVKAPAYKDSQQFPAWAVKAISVISALGFMDGYEDGEFKEDRAVTRAEAAAIFARVSGLSLKNTAPSFTDTQGHWAAGAIEAAAQTGMLEGYEDGSFAPDRALSRAEAVTLLNRVIGRPALTGKPQLWSDVPATYWAFGAIQAASSNSNVER